MQKYDLAVHRLYQISLRGLDSHGYFLDYNYLLEKKSSVFDGRSDGQFVERLVFLTDLYIFDFSSLLTFLGLQIKFNGNSVNLFTKS